MSHPAPHRLISGLLGAAVLAVSTPALATNGPNCGQRDQVVELLKTRHAEAPVSMGLAVNGTVVEVFSTKDGASWTLLMTMPNGQTCMIAAGESWTPVVQVASQIS